MIKKLLGILFLSLGLVAAGAAQASPADQDAMAAALYAQQGSAPWGGSCG